MAKIAFVTGLPGSGKSRSADSLKAEGYGVISGDHILHWTSVRLCPYLITGHTWAEDLWPVMIAHCDVRSVMRRVISDVLRPGPGPLIVEAYLLSIAGLRSALVSALGDAGRPIDESAVFWLDTPVAEIVTRVNARVRESRPWEPPIDQAEAERRRRFIDGHLSGSSSITEASSDALEGRIREFLGRPVG